jgi:hypothetical protein
MYPMSQNGRNPVIPVTSPFHRVKVMKAPEMISALLFGLVAFMALGALVVPYMADVGADALLAVISAVTPLR